jgi:hypothetical protein
MSARRRPHPAVRFVLICHYHFHTPRLLALEWWAGMVQSADPEVQRVLGLFNNYTGRTEMFIAWSWRMLPPKTLIDIVERLYKEQRLSRSGANKIQEGILALVAEAGSWKP